MNLSTQLILPPDRGTLRQFERLALELQERLGSVMLPAPALRGDDPPEPLVVERTRDVIQFHVHGDYGASVICMPDRVQIRVARTEWLGPHRPVPSSRPWRGIRLRRHIDVAETASEILTLVREAIAKREREFTRCRFCRRLFAPENMTDDACHGCASAHLGVVY